MPLEAAGWVPSPLGTYLAFGVAEGGSDWRTWYVRDIDTGKRVLRWSDSPRDRAKMDLPPNAVDHIRERWEVMANAALQKAGVLLFPMGGQRMRAVTHLNVSAEDMHRTADILRQCLADGISDQPLTTSGPYEK